MSDFSFVVASFVTYCHTKQVDQHCGRYSHESTVTTSVHSRHINLHKWSCCLVRSPTNISPTVYKIIFIYPVTFSVKAANIRVWGDEDYLIILNFFNLLLGGRPSFKCRESSIQRQGGYQSQFLTKYGMILNTRILTVDLCCPLHNQAWFLQNKGWKEIVIHWQNRESISAN